MLVKKYLSEVAEIQNPVDRLFVLKLRSKEKPFRFLPGQFLHLALDDYDPSNGWPESRCFSIQGLDSPDLVTLTFSVKGRFTTRMAAELAEGRSVWVKMPYGSLFQDLPGKSGCVFIAGGTGITPFLALFTDGSFGEYMNPKLYAGFRNESFDLYEDYLSSARKINPGFECIKYYEERDGMLDIERIYRDQETAQVYFISGPPLMIKEFKDYLKKQKVPDDRIKTDEWE